mgnify:FL=1|jgi:hypothetical protein
MIGSPDINKEKVISNVDESSHGNGEDSAQPSASTAPSSLMKPVAEEEEKRPNS